MTFRYCGEQVVKGRTATSIATARSGNFITRLNGERTRVKEREREIGAGRHRNDIASHCALNSDLRVFINVRLSYESSFLHSTTRQEAPFGLRWQTQFMAMGDVFLEAAVDRRGGMSLTVRALELL